jgi:hypothetical protein
MCAFITAASLFFVSAAFPQADPANEEIAYKNFKLERSACDTAILYRQTREGMDIGVSAIATGKGAEFRKWSVTDIKIHSGDERIRPDTWDKFYVTEASFFRIPAAVLFAALGTQISVSGTALEQGIAKAGTAIGLGLLVLAAKGDIAGQKCVFHFDAQRAESVFNSNSFVEIRIEDAGQHWQDSVKIGISKPLFKEGGKDLYAKLEKGELSKLVDDLGVKVNELEKEQALYKYGVNPEYDHIQAKIENLQEERGLAYQAWFWKNQDKK